MMSIRPLSFSFGVFLAAGMALGQDTASWLSGPSITNLVQRTFTQTQTNSDGTVTLTTTVREFSASDPNLPNETFVRPNPPVIVQPKPRPVIRIQDTGATAVNAAHTVHFDGNLNNADAVTVVFPDGVQMQGQVTALALSDDTGNRVWLGQVQDCTGEVPDPNLAQAIYRDAFRGIRADVLYTYDLTSFA